MGRLAGVHVQFRLCAPGQPTRCRRAACRLDFARVDRRRRADPGKHLINAKGSGYVAAILPSGMRAVATEISAETGAGGFILPNDRVDVILSRRDREAERLTGIESQVAETLLSDVRVLAIDQRVEDKSGRAMVGRTATLELSPHQVETLAMGRLMGTLSLALRSLADSDPSKRGSAPGQDPGAARHLNIVRFGVTTTTIPK
jgi:pilus assembly protein CpaB